jgi:phage shock protein C
MQGFQNYPQQLLDYLQIAEQQHTSDRKVADIQQLLTYNEELQKTEDSRANSSYWTFLTLAVGLFGVAGLAFLNQLFFWMKTTGPIAIGVALLAFAGIFVLGRIQGNALNKLRAKIEQLQARLVKPAQAKAAKGLFKSKRDKVIAGVCAGIASAIGVRPGLIRALFIALLFFTSGAMIPLYLILAVGMQASPKEEYS